MLDIPINNPEILQSLNKFLWFYDEREGEVAQCRLWSNNEDRDHFTGDNHRDSIMSRGSIHNGYPESGKYYSFKSDNKGFLSSLVSTALDNCERAKTGTASSFARALSP